MTDWNGNSRNQSASGIAYLLLVRYHHFVAAEKAVLGLGGGATTPPRQEHIGWPTVSDGEGWAWGRGDEGWGGGGVGGEVSKYKNTPASSSAAVERLFS